jgi:hypothetical protein
MTTDEEAAALDMDSELSKRALRIDFVCRECGREFSRTSTQASRTGGRNYYGECPFCGSTDVEIDCYVLY